MTTLKESMAILDEIKETLSIHEGRLDHLEGKLDVIFENLGLVE